MSLSALEEEEQLDRQLYLAGAVLGRWRGCWLEKVLDGSWLTAISLSELRSHQTIKTNCKDETDCNITRPPSLQSSPNVALFVQLTVSGALIMKVQFNI